MKIAFTLVLGSLTFAALAAPTNDKWDISKLDASKLPPAAEQADVTYAKDIRPLLQESCFRCHSAERHKGELRLDSLEAVLKGGKDGKVVIPGDSPTSLLLFAVAQVDDDIAMPPKPGHGGPGGPGGPGNFGGQPNRGNPPPAAGPGAGGSGPGGFGGPPPGGPGGPGGFGGPGFGPPPKPLTTNDVALIRAWIDQGAK